MDRIEWKDAKGRVHAVRALNRTSVEKVTPVDPARPLMKWDGQRASQGYYWCAGSQSMVRHESMSEFTALMLLDHELDIIEAVAQPMLLTFPNGLFHTPDFLIRTAFGEAILVDVHDSARTSETDALKFELTRLLCERVGWRFELFDMFTDITRWSLEMMCRYHHPRYEPDASTRSRILSLATKHKTFGALRNSLRTDKPGEYLPAVFHLMWQRAIRFDIHAPFTDNTRLHVA
ncbi:TnsA-like heteromeric transposase endonuclease subunit [Microbacterium sp. AGC62]